MPNPATCLIALILNFFLLLGLVVAGVIPIVPPDVSEPCEPGSRQGRCIGR